MTRYSVIVVDPPWAYGSASATAKGTAESQYATMGNGGKEINRVTGAGVESIIEATPVREWADDNAHLYLWATNPKLPFAFDVMKAWGFIYKTTITWVKTRKDGGVGRGGMGWFYRGATEHVLFGVKGNKPIPAALRRENVVMAQPSGHSVKPVEFYASLRSIYPDDEKMIDAYARRPHDRFAAWGLEAPQEAAVTPNPRSRSQEQEREE